VTRRGRVLVAGMIVVAAATLGVAGSRLDADSAAFSLNDAYFVVSWGLGPFAFVTALLAGTIALAYRDHEGPLVGRLATSAWVAYLLVKVASWSYANRLAARVLESGESFLRVSPANAVLMLGGPVLAVVCTILGLTCLARYAFRARVGSERAA